MEAAHKSFKDWHTVDHAKFKLRANDATAYDGETVSEIGTYNVLLDGCTKDLYNNSTETNESSHKLFRGTFPGGFVWEVLDVFSGPPVVGFSWRHWGRFSGKYKENVGDGQTVQLFGFGVATVNESLQFTNIQVYFKPDEFLQALSASAPDEDIEKIAEELKNKSLD